MTDSLTVVELELPSGRAVAVRAVSLGGAQDVGALDALHFRNVTETIEDIAEAISEAISKAAPKKATVSFGVEIAVKAGKLVSLLTEADGKATLNVTMEWGN